MQGLMMDFPLTLQHAFNRAVRFFPRKEIVTRTENGMHRYTYSEWGKRTDSACPRAPESGSQPG